MIKLITRTGPLISGGFPFKDPRTGMDFNGMEGTFDDQVSKIAAHRFANPEKYPRNEVGFLDRTSIENELEAFQANRLNNSPLYFYDDSKPQGQSLQQPAGKIVADKYCAKCGGSMAEIYCQTCSSRRVIGVKCQTCGNCTYY